MNPNTKNKIAPLKFIFFYKKISIKNKKSTHFSCIFYAIIFPPITAVPVHIKCPNKAPIKTVYVSSVANAIVVI